MGSGAGEARSRAEEVFYEYPEAPERPTTVKRMRSTVVTSSWASLRARGVYDRYWAAFDDRQRAVANSVIAGAWLPAEFMFAHYEACESLELGPEVIQEIGRGVGERMHESALLALKRLATGAGITPWTALGQYGRFFTRVFEGGAVRITKRGPKDAHFTVRDVQFSRFAYFRGTFAGIHEAGLALFAHTMHVHLMPLYTDSSFSMRISWV